MAAWNLATIRILTANYLEFWNLAISMGQQLNEQLAEFPALLDS